MKIIDYCKTNIDSFMANNSRKYKVSDRLVMRHVDVMDEKNNFLFSFVCSKDDEDPQTIAKKYITQINKISQS